MEFFVCPVTRWDVQSAVAQNCAYIPTPGKKVVEGVGWKKLWDLLSGDTRCSGVTLLFPPLHSDLLLKATEQVCQA